MQAAPRQSFLLFHAVQTGADAPRAGSAEAKLYQLQTEVTDRDAPRAGSAEAKDCVKRLGQDNPDAPRAGSAEAKVSG